MDTLHSTEPTHSRLIAAADVVFLGAPASRGATEPDGTTKPASTGDSGPAPHTLSGAASASAGLDHSSGPRSALPATASHDHVRPRSRLKAIQFFAGLAAGVIGTGLVLYGPGLFRGSLPPILLPATAVAVTAPTPMALRLPPFDSTPGHLSVAIPISPIHHPAARRAVPRGHASRAAPIVSAEKSTKVIAVRAPRPHQPALSGASRVKRVSATRPHVTSLPHSAFGATTVLYRNPATASAAVASASPSPVPPTPTTASLRGLAVVAIPSNSLALISSTAHGRQAVTPYHPGQTLPGGAVIRAIDPHAGRIVTDAGDLHVSRVVMGGGD